MGNSNGVRSWVEDLEWPEVERRVSDGALGLLPVGAASKEHGYHLPLGTDAIQARYYAGAMSERFDALIWPLVSYGYYPVFTDYAGSVSLQAETFASMVGEVVDGIAASGVSHTIILNTGISTIAPLESVLAFSDRSKRVHLVNCYAGPKFESTRASVEQQAWGGHADEIETALMLAVNPDVVTMTRALGNERPIERGMFNRKDPTQPNFSASGANGDPALATAEKGQLLLHALLDDVEDAIRAVVGETAS